MNNTDIQAAIKKIGDILKNTAIPILIALDGRSGSGKSTIAKYIGEKLGGVVIVSDDFWSGRL